MSHQEQEQYLLFPELDDFFLMEVQQAEDFDELMSTLNHIVVEELPVELVGALPNPTEADLKSPVFNALWEVVKTWDVNVPEYYAGYCGANGSHVKLLLNALQPYLKQPVKLPKF